ELQPVVRRDRDPKNFLAWSNRAMAYHKLGKDVQAIDALSVALSCWPQTWEQVPKERKDVLEKLGWNPTRFSAYREAEEHLLRLAGELINAGGNARGALTIFKELIDAGYAPAELKEHWRALREQIPPEKGPAPDFNADAPAKDTAAKAEDKSPWPANPWQLL